MKAMTPSWVHNTNGAPNSSAPGSSSTSSSPLPFSPYSPKSSSNHSEENITRLLALREISPCVKRPVRRLWGNSKRQHVDNFVHSCERIDAKSGLISWVESESLRHFSAKYCPLVPPPRSTIAAAFSPDGQTLASTHGDHTVKIICCKTGTCLKVLTGHRRTPWVVRFHPMCSEILASGSLDHEVRLWNANTAECIGSRDFYRPIASIAFHAQGELLAVASGHKLYVWQYNKTGDASSPAIVLRTRRSLRAVHFHPHAAPLLLTAEVNDLDAPDSPMTLATSAGYLQYPPPDVFFTHVRPNVGSGNSTSGVDGMAVHAAADSQIEGDSHPPEEFADETELQSQNQAWATPMEVSVATTQDHVQNTDRHEASEQVATASEGMNFPQESEDVILSDDNIASRRDQPGTTSYHGDNSLRLSLLQGRQSIGPIPAIHPPNVSANTNQQFLLGNGQSAPHQYFPVTDHTGWEIPFLQGWLMGQSHAGLPPNLPIVDGSHGGLFGISAIPSDVMTPEMQHQHQSVRTSLLSSTTASGGIRIPGRPGGRHRSRSRMNVQSGISVGDGASALAMVDDAAIDDDQEALINPGTVEADTAAAHASMAAAAAAAELPCTVKLRIWPHNIKEPCAQLDPDKCRLTIPHAVLCSEMGAHFSPCGRFLAACVACVLPHDMEGGLHSQANQGATGMSTSPTRHSIPAQQVVYELRIYSLEEETFGKVLASRAIRAAHCLTSIQFSPTSAHILLAYGRRHNSLLRGIVVDGTTTIPIYTILEIYRVSNMELVRVLPSAEDEVNVACFHPLVGGGLVYGTKEGKLRILQHDKTQGSSNLGGISDFEHNLFEGVFMHN